MKRLSLGSAALALGGMALYFAPVAPKPAPKKSNSVAIVAAAPPAKTASTKATVATRATTSPNVSIDRETELRRRLDHINGLAQIVLPTEAKLDGLRELLSDYGLRREIDRTLSDPKSYSGEGFERKLRLLDAMYEGMKFPERNLKNSYLGLATGILAEEPPPEFSGDAELMRQFVADRTEIALTLMKVFPEEAGRVEMSAKAKNANSANAFEQARQLYSTYEVSL